MFYCRTIHPFLPNTIHIFKSELASVRLHPAVPSTHKKLELGKKVRALVVSIGHSEAI